MAKLYIVPTPIGNLDDITLRAINVLREVDFILAEDTRTTSVLLRHLGIEKKLYSHHKFNEHATVRLVAESIAAGRNAALVSDAGTPGISDPGFLLVRTCVEQGIEVETLPGATALIPALVQSGFPCDRFCFEGFLPQKKGRASRLQSLSDEERTMIFYESPYRVVKCLEQFAETFGADRPVARADQAFRADRARHGGRGARTFPPDGAPRGVCPRRGRKTPGTARPDGGGRRHGRAERSVTPCSHLYRYGRNGKRKQNTDNRYERFAAGTAGAERLFGMARSGA